MEELRLPSFSRSASSSPERKECKSEPISFPSKNEKSEAQKQGSLDSLKSLSEQNKPDIVCEEPSPQQKDQNKADSNKISAVNKLKQISRHIEEETDDVPGFPPVDSHGKGVKVPIEICVTEHEVDETEILPDFCLTKHSQQTREAQPSQHTKDSQETQHKVQGEGSMPTTVRAEESGEQDNNKDISTADNISPKKN